MRYFSVTEWLKSATTNDNGILRKIEWWIDVLTPIRAALGEKIIITHGLRAGAGTSQHYFRGMGATDLRVDLSTNDYKGAMQRLRTLLIEEERIKRICYYPHGNLFPNSGFHLDCKTRGRQLFVSHPDIVDWRPVSGHEMTNVIQISKPKKIDNDV